MQISQTLEAMPHKIQNHTYSYRGTNHTKNYQGYQIYINVFMVYCDHHIYKGYGICSHFSITKIGDTTVFVRESRFTENIQGFIILEIRLTL